MALVTAVTNALVGTRLDWSTNLQCFGRAMRAANKNKLGQRLLTTCLRNVSIQSINHYVVTGRALGLTKYSLCA